MLPMRHTTAVRKSFHGLVQRNTVATLKAKQMDDGSFYNPEGAINKEDDPMLATAMAVIILTRVIR